MLDTDPDHPVLSIATLRAADPLRAFAPLQLTLSWREQEAFGRSCDMGPGGDQQYYMAQNDAGIVWGVMGCRLPRDGRRTVHVEPFAAVGYCDAQVRAIAGALLAHAERMGREQENTRLDLVVPDRLLDVLEPVLRVRGYEPLGDGRYTATL